MSETQPQVRWGEFGERRWGMNEVDEVRVICDRLEREGYPNISMPVVEMRKTLDELAALREQTRFIPCSEWLPESGQYVELIIHAYLDRHYWWLQAEGVHVDALPERHGVAWRPLPPESQP